MRARDPIPQSAEIQSIVSLKLITVLDFLKKTPHIFYFTWRNNWFLPYRILLQYNPDIRLDTFDRMKSFETSTCFYFHCPSSVLVARHTIWLKYANWIWIPQTTCILCVSLTLQKGSRNRIIPALVESVMVIFTGTSIAPFKPSQLISGFILEDALEMNCTEKSRSKFQSLNLNVVPC